MNFKNIDKWSFKYAILRAYVSFVHNVFFYRKVHITGKENLPENTPLFFAPNHQNALMDALIIICNIKQQPVFVARADIFKSPIIAKILIIFKILPAYRFRDGRENLGKNEETFDIAVNILENKHIFALFPETTHNDKRHLRVLKKGVQRIVFQAEEKNNFTLGVKVVPIGIDYSNYWNFRSDIHLSFGKPIDLNEFNEIYKSNPQKAMLALRDKLSEEIKKLIIHIPSMEYYLLYDFLREFYKKHLLSKLSLKNNYGNGFIAEQKIIDSIAKFSEKEPEKFKLLDIQTKAYRKILNKLNIRNWVLEKNENIFWILLKSIGLLAFLPVFLYGWLNNIMPYYLPHPIRKKIQDPQFISSVNFVIGLILYPVFYLIQFALVWIFSDVWWIKFIYLVSLPITGLIAFHWHRCFIKIKAQIKFYFYKKQKDFKRVQNFKKNIEEKMDIITNDFLNKAKS